MSVHLLKSRFLAGATLVAGVSRRLFAVGAAALAITLVGLASPAATPQVEAAQWCWCTTYVRNAYNLSSNFPDAQGWAGSYLINQGFRKVSDPTPWAIVVFSGQYPGIDPRGHVALVANSTRTSSGWKLTVRGANQPANSNNLWAEQNCTNVSDWTLANPVPYSSPYVSYWVR